MRLKAEKNRTTLGKGVGTKLGNGGVSLPELSTQEMGNRRVLYFWKIGKQ